jgi:nicotinate-nucleotide adenylyltransferase
MVSLSLMNEEHMKLCTIEFDMPTPSYTIHTVHKLKDEYSSFNFHILCGTDVVNSLPAWYKFKELIQAVKFLVCSREIENQFTNHSLVQDYPEQFEFIAFDPIEISSTQIRECIALSGKSNDLSESVNQFIFEKKLYQ